MATRTPTKGTTTPSRLAAVRRAPSQLRAAAIGDHGVCSRVLQHAVGSKTRTSPSAARARCVSRTTSALTDVDTTGPCHSRIAGTTRPVVLPDCEGPTTSTDVRAWALISVPLYSPRVILPACGASVCSGVSSSRSAHCALRCGSSRCRWRATNATARATPPSTTAPHTTTTASSTIASGRSCRTPAGQARAGLARCAGRLTTTARAPARVRLTGRPVATKPPVRLASQMIVGGASAAIATIAKTRSMPCRSRALIPVLLREAVRRRRRRRSRAPRRSGCPSLGRCR